MDLQCAKLTSNFWTAPCTNINGQQLPFSIILGIIFKYILWNNFAKTTLALLVGLLLNKFKLIITYCSIFRLNIRLFSLHIADMFLGLPFCFNSPYICCNPPNKVSSTAGMWVCHSVPPQGFKKYQTDITQKHVQNVWANLTRLRKYLQKKKKSNVNISGFSIRIPPCCYRSWENHLPNQAKERLEECWKCLVTSWLLRCVAFRQSSPNLWFEETPS